MMLGNTVFKHSALLSIVALAMVPMSAFADDKPSALFETKLDIDNDGKTDRAVLVLVGSDRTDVGPLTDELVRGRRRRERGPLPVFGGRR